MPIYAYRCAACGHTKDVLQKLADAPLTVCPACGAAAFAKQVTAAGFQLKGSGWYATDFKNGGGAAAKKPAEAATAPAPAGKDTPVDAPSAPAAASPAASSPAPASDPAR